jgi:hypothetical protein
LLGTLRLAALKKQQRPRAAHPKKISIHMKWRLLFCRSTPRAAWNSSFPRTQRLLEMALTLGNNGCKPPETTLASANCTLIYKIIAAWIEKRSKIEGSLPCECDSRFPSSQC